MRPNNKEISDYLENLEKRISNAGNFSKQMGRDFIKDKRRLAKTDKGARVNARLEATVRGEIFDESETPPEEISTIEEDMINELAKREMEELLGQ